MLKKARGSAWYNRVQAVRWGTHRALVAVSAIFLTAMMLLSVTDATGRYLFVRPVQGTIEISQLMMAYVILLGLAYALIKGQHVRVTLVLDRLPFKLRLAAEIVTDVAGIFFCSLLLWGSWEMFWASWVTKELVPAAIYLVYWPSKVVMPIGFFFMTIEFLVYLIRHLWDLTRASGNA